MVGGALVLDLDEDPHVVQGSAFHFSKGESSSSLSEFGDRHVDRNGAAVFRRSLGTLESVNR